MKIKNTKLIINISIIVGFIILGHLSFRIGHSALAATTPTPNTTSTSSAAINQQIDNLQAKIASTVAHLNLASKKGFIGTVTDSSDTEINLTDINGNGQAIDVDEFTKFSSDSNSSFGISDIKKGMVIGVLGIYNKDSKRTLARFIDQENLPIIFDGAVTNIDNNNYIITVTTDEGKDIPVYIQDITKTLGYTKDGGLVRSGFSKISLNERVMVVGFPNKNNSKQILATRFIHFPDLAVSPKIPIVKSTLPSANPK